MAELVGSEKLRELADLVKEKIPGLGFSIFVFPLNQSGMTNYISNCQRADIKKVLREILVRWERGEELTVHSEN